MEKEIANSWGDLKYKDSSLVLLLNDICKYEEEEKSKENIFSNLKIMTLGYLWCNGSDKHKAQVFFEIVVGKQ